MSSLWQEGYQLALARETFSIDGRTFSGGTVLVRTGTNPDSLHARIADLAVENEVGVVPVDSALVESGRDLGDRTVADLTRPTIAVVTERPTASTAYGAIWFLLERVYDVPFTALKADDVGSADLSKYNVIVLPDGQAGGYAGTFGTAGTEKLKRWVEDGGTLVAIKGAAAWASRESVGLTTARDKFAEAPPAREGEPRGERPDPPKRIDTVPGAFVAVEVDGEHYIGTGVEGPVAALFRSNIVFTPSRRGARVGTVDADRPIVAGFAFDEALEHLKGAPFVWDEPTGRGHVTLFADDVTFRTFLHGAHRLLLNAILLGPSM